MMFGLGLGGLGLGSMAGAAQISVALSGVTLNPFSATVTPPSGYAIIAGAASINIPAKSGSYGTAQTVAATVTGGSAGTVTETTAGSVVAALVLAGWLNGETPTLSVTVDVVASVLPDGVKALFDISALSSLYQDSAGTIPVTAAGQSVGRQSDKSGNGYHATQSNGALRAKYQIDGSGHPYLLFDGLDDGYVTPTITWGTDEVTIVAGVRKLSDTARNIIADLSGTVATSTGSFYLSSPLMAGGSTVAIVPKGTAYSAAVASGYAAPTTMVVTAKSKISTDVNVLRVNGSQVASVSTDLGSGSFLDAPLYIGRSASLYPLNGRLYCLAIWNRILSADELAQAEAWANARTGAY